MLGVNKAIIIGNIGRDPEMRYTPQGQPVCNFSVATNEKYNDKTGQKQEKTEWHNIVVWGKLAENVNKYLSKGKHAYIEGKIATRSWEKDGAKHYRTEIIANQIHFLSSNDSNTDQPDKVKQNDTKQVIEEDDLPF